MENQPHKVKWKRIIKKEISKSCNITAQTVKRLSTMWETRVWSLGWEDPLEKEMAIYSSTIAWKIPWTEEPGRLQSMGLQRVGHDRATLLSLFKKQQLEPDMEQQTGSKLRKEFVEDVYCHPAYLTYIHSESEVAQSCPTLCEPMDCSLPGSSVHGIFQAIVLEWIAISFSRGSSWPRDRTQVSHIVGRRFTIWATSEVHTAHLPLLRFLTHSVLVWLPTSQHLFMDG